MTNPRITFQSTADDPTVRHAFTLFGHEEGLFITHLPMLHMDAHAYHLVLSVRLPSAATQTFLTDREKHPQSSYWLGNTSADPMHLPEIIDGTRTSFIASLWRDIPDRPEYMEWPWADENPIVNDAELQIEEVLYHHHFDASEDYPPDLRYILFGDNAVAVLHHRMVKDPDFDHLVALDSPPVGFGSAGAEAFEIAFANLRRPNDTPCTNPLPAGQHEVETGQGQRQIRVGSTVWYSTKCMTPNLDNPCPAKPS